MNTITNSSIRKISIALAAILLAATFVAVAPTAHADEGYSIPEIYDVFSGGGGDTGSGYQYFPTDYTEYYPTDYTEVYPTSYDTSYDSGYSYGGSFGGSSYMGGSSGWTTPSFTGSGYMSSGYTPTQYQYVPQLATIVPPAPSYTNVNTNVNENTCTGNSCNTVYDDHSVFNAPTTVTVTAPTTVTTDSHNIVGTPVAQAQFCPQGMLGVYPNCAWPAPQQPQPQYCAQGMTGVYPNCAWPQQPTYDICPNLAGIQSTIPAGFYIQNGNCYQNQAQPVQPYVTLSSVPYTGLDLGPVGTVLYWGFLVLMCLLGAYLIAVKKVQNSFVAWLTNSGSTAMHSAHVAHAATAAYAAPKAPIARAQFVGIDPFIASQISR